MCGLIVRGFVIDDPPGVASRGERRGSGAKNAIDLHRAQAARGNARPSRFTCGIGMRCENPFCLRVITSAKNDPKCMCGDALGLGRVDSQGAKVCGDTRLDARERRLGDFTFFRNAKLREILK